MLALEYGIVCQASDEKQLVKNVNLFLAGLEYKKMAKKVPSGKRDPDGSGDDQLFAHYYCQFLKQHPRWYFDLYPNVNLNGAARFPLHPEAGWTMYINPVLPENNSAADNLNLNGFFTALAAGTGFPVVLLHTYAKVKIENEFLVASIEN